ncbi:MAG TPA: vitamin K epoxide reductase family protein [Gemmatimonadaceae bacterium]|nr:vitamin K epoxide reductase family protein [Gemmatimonadaceae bacterium]
MQNPVRSSDAEASALSRELRESDDASLRRRRGVVALSLVAAGAMGVIALYQMGITKHIPEPPLPKLDADTVDASAEAYQMLETPDAVLGFGSYGVTMALAAMGGAARAERQPLLPLALAGKVAIDVVQAGRLTIDQFTKHRAFCSWCLLAAGATFAMAPLVVPEARAALRNMASHTVS